MGFRIGRKHAVHTYPEPRSGPPGPPGPPLPGGVQVIRYRVGPAAGVYDSVTPIPLSAVVLRASFDNDTNDDPANIPFAANTTATIGTTAAPTLFQDATENTPDTAGNYQTLLNTLITPGNQGTGKVRTVLTVAGSGSAAVTIEYVVTPQP